VITKQQTQKLIDKLEAHRTSLLFIQSALKEHHGNSESLPWLAQAIKGLDEAADVLGTEIES